MTRNEPPPYVSLVLSPFVRLENLDPERRRELDRRGISVVRDASGREAARFADSGGWLLENPALIDLLGLLNDAGLAFMDDPRQGWSPADVMSELQAQGKGPAVFTSIAWRGPDDWFTTLRAKNAA